MAGSRSRMAADVIAEEADQPAEERRRIGRDDDRPVEASDQSAGHRERVGAGRGGLEDGDRIGGEVGPAGVAPRPGALEQDEARQVSKRLGRIDRARAGHTVGQSTEPERRTGSIGRDHLRPMIRRVAWQVRPGAPLGSGHRAATSYEFACDRRNRAAAPCETGVADARASG